MSVRGRMWNSIVSVTDLCLFIIFPRLLPPAFASSCSWAGRYVSYLVAHFWRYFSYDVALFWVFIYGPKSCLGIFCPTSFFFFCWLDQQTLIWISAEAWSCALQYVFSFNKIRFWLYRTMLWKWLKRSCLQCTLQAAYFCLAFSILLLKYMPITWRTHRNWCSVHHSDFFRFRFLKQIRLITFWWKCKRSHNLDQDRSKLVDENNLYIWFDIIIKIACFVISWQSSFFFSLFADSMSKPS